MTTAALDKAIRAGCGAHLGCRYQCGNPTDDCWHSHAITAALRTLAEPDEAGIAAADEAFWSHSAEWRRLYDELPAETIDAFTDSMSAALTAYINKVLGETK